MAARLYCSCGRPLKIKVRHDGAIFKCPVHGIVWRYSTGGRKPSRRRTPSTPGPAGDSGA